MTRDPLFWLEGTPEDFIDEAQCSAWEDARQTLVPVDPDDVNCRTEYDPAPMLENVAKFLRRGDPIKPSLAKIIGRLLAGETFCSLPRGLALPEQFDDDGCVIWNTGRPTRATIEAFTYRLVNGALKRAGRGNPHEPFRAGAIWRAAKEAREAMAEGKPRSKALTDAADRFDVTVAEVRRQIQFFERAERET